MKVYRLGYMQLFSSRKEAEKQLNKIIDDYPKAKVDVFGPKYFINLFQSSDKREVIKMLHATFPKLLCCLMED